MVPKDVKCRKLRDAGFPLHPAAIKKPTRRTVGFLLLRNALTRTQKR
ncbi:unknown protein [Cronobacter turicensis z3032]|uniref:Uncharacterized protein n=1 Tax=Cronobacter turicensis (strain DSM 18703 / CCUG 55852 / LMG 23827 / z3032) TaxID=693216 RepID=C9XTP7_CROTZ|nr:unknown protein [Cronobacter turicensis z3032]